MPEATRKPRSCGKLRTNKLNVAGAGHTFAHIGQSHGDLVEVGEHGRLRSGLATPSVLTPALLLPSHILSPREKVVANLIRGFVSAAALWIFVARVAVADSGHLAQQPLARGGLKGQAARHERPRLGRRAAQG